MSFAHLTLATRDVQATAAFFERTMRWRRVAAPTNAGVELAWVEIVPGQQIHILRRDDFTPPPFETEFGRHFAVLHPAADLPALRQRLAEHGAAVMEPIRVTPFPRFFFRDPNGYVFEVISREDYDPEGSDR